MSKQQEIFDFITSQLNPGTEVGFDPGANLLEAGVLDSTAMIELIVWLEETYDISIETEDLTPENFGTLDAMASYIGGAQPGV